jgi:hypothetical protein
VSPHLSRMDRRDENVPSGRLGRIAAAMLEAGEAHPEHRAGDRVIVMLDDDVEKRGMIAHGGYDEDEGSEAFVNLLGHVDALAQGNGMQLQFIPMAGPPGQG